MLWHHQIERVRMLWGFCYGEFSLISPCRAIHSKDNPEPHKFKLVLRVAPPFTRRINPPFVLGNCKSFNPNSPATYRAVTSEENPPFLSGLSEGAVLYTLALSLLRCAEIYTDYPCWGLMAKSRRYPAPGACCAQISHLEMCFNGSSCQGLDRMHKV